MKPQMKINVTWVEQKELPSGSKLINGTFVDDKGTQFEATIWEKDKEGKVFPNFAQITAGQSIDGNPWKNPTNGKITIYPPKPEILTSGAPRGAGAQARKEASITKAQDRKEENIKYSSTMRDAVLIATTLWASYADHEPGSSEMEESVKYWRQWLWEHWDDPNDYPPFTS